MTAGGIELRVCPRCSNAAEPSQEYCLECGLRLPQGRQNAIGRASTGLTERHPWSAGWAVPALLGLAIAILGTGAAIGISSNEAPETAPATATGGSLLATEQAVTLTALGPPARPRPRTRPTRPRRAAVPRAISWPAGRRGWTIVLLSSPQANGRAAVVKRAEEARRGGLRRVGVLNSSRFASLHPGYYVIFHGFFDSEAEATSALARARGVVRLAYPREIVPG